MQTLARFDPAELEGSNELIAQGSVVLSLHCNKGISVIDENAGAYLCLHVIHSLLFYEPNFLQGMTQIHIMFLCVTICILISALADRLFFFTITRILPGEHTCVDIKKIKLGW